MEAQESSAPRVRVAALITMGDRVVVVRHRKNSSAYHLLPGGGVALGETLSAALTREVAEETGLICETGDLVLVNDSIDPQGSRHVVNITFSCTVTAGSITDAPADQRVEAVELVYPTELASLDLRPPVANELVEWLNSSAAARYVENPWTADTSRVETPREVPDVESDEGQD